MVGSLHNRQPIETGKVLYYSGSAVINGVKQNAMRGPHYDTIYELSNIFKFDVEIKEGFSAAKYRAGLIDGDIDLAMPWGSSYFSSYQVFQVGRFGYELNSAQHLTCFPPTPQVIHSLFLLCKFQPSINTPKKKIH